MNANSTNLQQIHRETYRFADARLAFEFANTAKKAMGVMLGDDGRYWVATLATCARLERMGYEWAPKEIME